MQSAARAKGSSVEFVCRPVKTQVFQKDPVGSSFEVRVQYSFEIPDILKRLDVWSRERLRAAKELGDPFYTFDRMISPDNPVELHIRVTPHDRGSPEYIYRKRPPWPTPSLIGPYELEGESMIKSAVEFGQEAWGWSPAAVSAARYYLSGKYSLKEASARMASTATDMIGQSMLNPASMFMLRADPEQTPEKEVIHQLLERKITREHAARRISPEQFQRISAAQLVATGLGMKQGLAPIGWFGIMVHLTNMMTVNDAVDFLKTAHPTALSGIVDDEEFKEMFKEADDYFEGRQPKKPSVATTSTSYDVRLPYEIAEDFHLPHAIVIDRSRSLAPEELITIAKAEYPVLLRFDFVVETNAVDQLKDRPLDPHYPAQLRYIGSVATRHLESVPLPKSSKLEKYFSNDAPKPKGNIIGKKVTPVEEEAWRRKIAEESDEVRAANPEIVELVEKRAARLLEREPELTKMLKQKHIPDESIDVVMNALQDPARTFQWFDAIFEAPEKYILGTESALSANLIRYLQDQEAELGYDDLIDEYILHETMERTKLDHAKIIILTREFFERDRENPLGEALRGWSDARYFSDYKPRISGKAMAALVRQIRMDVDQIHAQLDAAPTWVEKAQIWLRYDGIVLANNELNAQGFEKLLMGRLEEKFDRFGDTGYPDNSVLFVARAMIELDRQRTQRFFKTLLSNSNADTRLAAADILEAELEWEPRKPADESMMLMALQEWDELAAYGKDHPTEVIAACRIALLGSGYDKTSGDARFVFEAAAVILGKLAQPSESVLAEGLHAVMSHFSDPHTLGYEFVAGVGWDSRLSVVEALRQIPHPSEKTITALDQSVAQALADNDDFFATEAGRTLENLREAHRKNKNQDPSDSSKTGSIEPAPHTLSAAARNDNGVFETKIDDQGNPLATAPESRKLQRIRRFIELLGVEDVQLTRIQERVLMFIRENNPTTAYEIGRQFGFSTNIGERIVYGILKQYKEMIKRLRSSINPVDRELARRAA